MAKVTRSEVQLAIEQAVATPHDKHNLAAAVRISLDWLAQNYPGNAVEFRVPPLKVVQFSGGSTHRRGIPPSVVELDSTTCILIFNSPETIEAVYKSGHIRLKGITASDLRNMLIDRLRS